MGLADNLTLVAENLIETYGNTVTIETTTNDGVYNPQTGSYGTPVSVSHTKSAYVASPTTQDLSNSGLPDSEWGKVSFVATMVEDNETSLLNNKWTIDNVPVMKIKKTQAQNTTIIIKVYCGM